MTTQYHIVNLILDFFSIVLLLIIIVSIGFQKRKSKKLEILSLSAILLFCAIAYFVIMEINLYRAAKQDDDYILTIGLGIAAFILYLWYLFVDKDLKFQGLKWEGKRIIFLLSALFLPLIAFIIEINVGHLNIMMPTLTVSFLMAYLYEQLEEEKISMENEKNLLSVKVSSMTEQIHSHFLFNSLTIIRELCRIDPPKAMRALDDFSGYLRANIGGIEKMKLISFEQELKHIRQYIALEKAEPNLKLDVIYDLQYMDFYLPPLSVEPIVENAVHYGVIAKSGEGTVYIKTEKIGNWIYITVEDEGKGELNLMEKQKEHNGISLNNARQRLEILVRRLH
ncbi:MAG: histidine kinase [Clostridia bacterium]|nr:histidine kinase [Clostridia bacterium]